MNCKVFLGHQENCPHNKDVISIPKYRNLEIEGPFKYLDIIIYKAHIVFIHYDGSTTAKHDILLIIDCNECRQAIIKKFNDSGFKIIDIDKLENRVLNQESRILALENMIQKLWYAPPNCGGPGYVEHRKTIRGFADDDSK